MNRLRENKSGIQTITEGKTSTIRGKQWNDMQVHRSATKNKRQHTRNMLFDNILIKLLQSVLGKHIVIQTPTRW